MTKAVEVSRAEKERIVAVAMEPGAVATEVARAAGIYGICKVRRKRIIKAHRQ